MASTTAVNEKSSPRKLFQSIWVRIGLGVAAVETVLVVVDVIPRWVTVLVAVPVIAAYFFHGRRVTQPSVRQAYWAAAFSQALVLLVPIALWIAGAAVVVVLAVVGVLIVVALVIDR